MSKPLIFSISAVWDEEASVWSGHNDEIPAAADAPTLDGLLEKMSAMALDLLPDNHPDADPRCSVPANRGHARGNSGGGLMAPQFDKPLRELLREAGCKLVRQG